MWIVTSALLMIVGVGLLLTATVAYRTADDLPATGKAGLSLWGLLGLAVCGAGLGVWLLWAAAFMVASNL